MPEEINLLPRERRSALRRAYLLRLGVVALALATALVVAAGALLVPTYLYLASAERDKDARLSGIESSISTTEETALAKRLAALESDATTIAKLAATPTASSVIRTMLAVPRSGVTLTGMNYVPALAKQPGTLAVSGTASTRDDLRGYQLALLGAPGVLAADLPVSSYAKDQDIPFTITVTLATSTPP